MVYVVYGGGTFEGVQRPPRVSVAMRYLPGRIMLTCTPPCRVVLRFAGAFNCCLYERVAVVFFARVHHLRCLQVTVVNADYTAISDPSTISGNWHTDEG